GLEVEGEVEASGLRVDRRVARGVPHHLEGLDQRLVRPETAHGLVEQLLEELLGTARSADLAECDREVRGVAVLEEGIPGMRACGPEDVGVPQGERERAVSAAPGPEHGRWARSVPLADERKDLVQHVVLVPTRSRGVEVLATAERGETVRPYHDRFGRELEPDQSVEATGDAIAEVPRPLVVHPTGVGVAAEQDEQREAFGATGGGEVDGEVAFQGVPPGIPLEDPTREPVVLDLAVDRARKHSVALRFGRDTPGHRGPRRREGSSGSIHRGSSRMSAMARNRSPRPPDASDDVSAAFARIRADRSHGARSLAADALRTLSRLLDDWADRPPADFRPAARRVARALEEAQPAMGPFLRWAEDWRRIARASARA